MKSVMAIFFSILVAALLANSVIGLANKISENDDSRIEKDKFSMQAKFPYDGIRLPGNVLPLEYKVFLHPNITDDKFKFTGSVKIILDVKRETDSIIVHSKSLTHVYTGVFEHGHGINVEPDIEKEVPVTGTLTHEKHEMLMVQLGSRLSTKKKYLLYITFAGELASFLRGFYRSSYKTKTGEQRYLATTHFEATGARLAFPCFDEPAMKSHFSIVMVREPRHTALSNMPLEKTHVRKDGLLEDHFVKSVKMSTYLVAFVVCDFAHLSATSSRGIKVKVWAPEHLISQAELAIKAAPKILDYYEKFFKIDFPLPKQDLIAIPDFAMGAMENWGLITYRLTDLLFDEKQSSAANRQRVIVVIAHELAHQWFGNLVTMQWWNDIWLNEGFAAFVEYIGANITDPSMQMMDQFVNDNVHSALALDSKLSSHPISMPLSDPADIGGVFDTISYQKGSSVIRMMRDFIRPDRFLNGLAYYLQKFRFGNAVSDDLYACLGKATGDTIDVKKIMHTWTLQMGYPVVNVVRDPQNNNMAIFTQERFVTDVKNENEIAIEMSPFNYKWEVPLTFYFQRNTKLQRKWLHLEDESLKHPWNQKSGWLKVNVDQIGFYRVNYDKENWKALAAQLKLDHTKLSGADRSNIIDDAFALAKAGKLSQVQALDLTEYLKHEKDYVPFASGMDSLSSIGGLLHHRPGYASYEKYILDQISPLVSELGWEDSGSQLNKFLRSIVLRSAVSHNKSTSVKTAMKKYHEWMYHDKIVPVNLRSTVYLAGIKYGGQKEWDFMFQKFQNTIYPSEKRTLMFSLGDTSKLEILKSYLKKSLDQDVIKSQDTPHVIAKVASNAFGTVMARNFVKKNWNRLLIEHGTSTGIPRIISAVFGSGKTKAELSEAENFLNNHKLGSGKLAAKRAIAAIRNNINWLGKYEKAVELWFKSKVKN